MVANLAVLLDQKGATIVYNIGTKIYPFSPHLSIGSLQSLTSLLLRKVPPHTCHGCGKTAISNPLGYCTTEIRQLAMAVGIDKATTEYASIELYTGMAIKGVVILL